MSVEEAKRLLRRFRIVPNRLLGQNFMVEPTIFERLSEYAAVGKADVVLDAGAGFGFLTRFLADKCRRAIAVEKDPRVAEALREQLNGLANVAVIEGDVLQAELPEFNKLIAIPPYYLSTRLVTWLFECRIDSAVLILQRDFARKLVASVGSEEYGWLTVVAYHKAEVKLFDSVPKELFYPQPEVDSVIVRFLPRQLSSFKVGDLSFFRQMTRWLFNQRNKKLGNALVPFLKSTLKLSKEEAKKRVFALPFCDRRVRELSPKDFGALAHAFTE